MSLHDPPTRYFLLGEPTNQTTNQRTSMSSQVQTVLIAAAQSVAKVYVIGGVGYAARLFPRANPLLSNVPSVARFSFHTLTLCLIFSTIAKSVNLSSILEYWFVLVGGFVVLGVSYTVAWLSSRLLFGKETSQNQSALIVAVTFPNIVALPILIFPSLCEFEELRTSYELATYDECVDTTNTMVFLYFSVWSVCFWSGGYPLLVKNDDGINRGWRSNLYKRFSSPGMVALLAGLFTGCLPKVSKSSPDGFRM